MCMCMCVYTTTINVVGTRGISRERSPMSRDRCRRRLRRKIELALVKRILSKRKRIWDVPSEIFVYERA